MRKVGVYKRENIVLLDELHGTLKAELSGRIGAVMVFLGVARELMAFLLFLKRVKV